MFKFLKGLFSKQEEVDEVAFSDIDEWFDKKIQENLDIHEELDEIFTTINDEIRKLQINLNILQKAELRNKDVPQRAISLMEGNRDSYIRKIGDFVKQINFPEKNNFTNLSRFTEHLSKSSNELNKSTVKQYYILKEFFENEAKDVAYCIKNIDESGQQIVRLLESDKGFNYIHDVRETIKDIEKKITEREKTRKQINELDTKLKEAKAQKEKIETEMDNLETSSQYNAYSTSQTKKISTETEIRRHKENFSLVFSQMEKALRKYQHIAFDSDRDILNQYLISPVDALDSDRNFKILNVLKNVVYKINELDLDPAKKEKTKQAILRFNEVFLKDFLWKYDAAREKLREVNKRLTMNTIKTDINDTSYKMKHNGEQIAKISSEIDKLKNYISSLDIEKSVEGLQMKVSKLNPVKITL